VRQAFQCESTQSLVLSSADISDVEGDLQELMEVALFPADVRILASSNPSKERIMKRLLLSLSLTLFISGAVLAGEIPTVGYTPPPPPPPDGMQASTTTVPGEVPTVGLTYEMTDTTIDLIQMLLGFGV
jgi:hypothetical protein